MVRIGRSWALAKTSLGVIKRDKELILFPLISAFVVGLMLASWVSVLFFTGSYRFFEGLGTTNGRYAVYVMIFAFYLAAHVVVLYFNSALVGAAMVRLNGGDPTLGDGIRAANARLGRIVAWAIIGGTVGYVLRLLSQRGGLALRIAVWLVGAVWSVATFFVLPVLIFEDIGPIQAIRRSASLFRRTWAESLVGPLALGLVFFLFGLLGLLGPLVGLALGSRAALIVGFGAAIVYWLTLGVVASAAQGVLVAALYRYATTRQVPPGFDQGEMANPFFPKSRRGRKMATYRGY